ncbi:MAG: hypothetical protein WBB28_09490 [Crinalium sp.]
MVSLQTDYKSLSKVLPDYVTWIPRAKALELLEISDPQLRLDQAILLYLETAGFDYEPLDRGFSWNAFNCLWEFRYLVRQQGRNRAIAQINQRMEELNNERTGQESGREGKSSHQRQVYCE